MRADTTTGTTMGTSVTADALLDRVGPTRRPAGSPVGHQRWRHLLFLHWAVPAEAIRPLVPAPLSLDLHDGVAWVGLVPFAMEGVRPRFVPDALGLNFLETNVRTYVHHHGEPGVWFLSLDAASPLAVAVARARWHLPYFTARMKMELGSEGVHYASERAASPHPKLEVRYRPGDPLGASVPGELQFFLLERYLLFAERSGCLYRGQVHHRPYPAYGAEVAALADDLVAATGLPRPEGAPLVHYSPGVDVEIFALTPVG
jgi:uncharacterized protein YqjF (DUF2071 family)